MSKVSIIMGVYNAGDKTIIEKSILSIINQTYKDFEFIICDDGSTDNTLQYIKEIAVKDNRIKVIRNSKNIGLAYTLNKCIENSNSEYIARMDIDDYSRENRLQKQIEFLEKNPNYSLVGCNSFVFDKNGIFGEMKMPEIIEKENFLFNNPIIHPTVVVRKKDLKSVGGYNTSKECIRVADYDLWMRMFTKGYKMYNLQENLFEYRRESNNCLKRKYKYRINEAKIRYKNYKNLHLLPIGYIYMIKPLIIGLIPYKIWRLLFINEL